MAYTKILVVHGRLDKSVSYAQNQEKTSLATALDYALNRDKTERTCFETAINCDREQVFDDMMATKRRWGKENRIRKGYHIIQSFAPGEVTPEQAHEIGVELVRRLLGDRYEAVVATHLDKAHLHSHIVFNSVSFVDGYMYRDTMKDYFGGNGIGIRGTSDAICMERGLSIIEPDPEAHAKRQSRPEWAGKTTIRDTVRLDIDNALRRSYTFSMLLRELRSMGYEVNENGRKHISVRPPGGSRNIRLDSLGDGYRESDLMERLFGQEAKNKAAPPPPVSPFLTPGRHYRSRSAIRRSPTHKLKGFQALCFKYLCLLRGIKRGHPYKKRVPLSLRQELIKFDRYQRQFLYLHKNRLETAAQVSMQYDAIQARIDYLTDQRKELYALRRAGDDTVSVEIGNITDRLRPLRRELKMCLQIEENIEKMKEVVNEAAQRPTQSSHQSQSRRRPLREKR